MFVKVCSTVYTVDGLGTPRVSKGCVSATWCARNAGCDPSTSTCVSCCHGYMCNVAGASNTPPQPTSEPVTSTTTGHSKLYTIYNN